MKIWWKRSLHFQYHQKDKTVKSKLKKYVKPIRGKTFLQNKSRLEQKKDISYILFMDI